MTKEHTEPYTLKHFDDVRVLDKALKQTLDDWLEKSNLHDTHKARAVMYHLESVTIRTLIGLSDEDYKEVDQDVDILIDNFKRYRGHRKSLMAGESMYGEPIIDDEYGMN